MSAHDEQSGLILLVEDNRQIAEMVGEFLERRGYSVDYAADGVSGLHLAVSNSYDVIVLDLMLPGLSGLDVLSRLREEANQSNLPIVVISAWSDARDDALAAGADRFVLKPFLPDDLRAVVQELVP